MNEISGINMMQAQRIMPGSMSRLQPGGASGSAGVDGVGGAIDRERDAYNLVMGRATGVTLKATPKERAREAAEQLVAITFVRPILEEMRQSNNAAPPFAPSSGEKQFRSFLDAKLANEITRSAQFPLVDRIARDLNREPIQVESLSRRPVGRMA